MCEGNHFSLSIAIKSLFVIMAKAKLLIIAKPFSKVKLLKIAKIKIVARLLAK